MVLLIINLVSLIFLWLFAFMGLKQYEHAQQDGDTGLMKLFVHLLLVVTISANIYYYVNSERSPVVPNSTMVEEIKK
jgi:hypothetical protein